MPWFYLVPEAEVLDSGEAVLARLLSGRVDPLGVALLEKAPAVRLDGAGDRAGDRVERLAYDPKEGLIRLRTHSAGARVLVVSENYQSNWSVWVDGEEMEMVRVTLCVERAWRCRPGNTKWSCAIFRRFWLGRGARDWWG